MQEEIYTNNTISTKDTISKLKMTAGKTKIEPYDFNPMTYHEIKSTTQVTELDLYAFYAIRNTPPTKQSKEKYILQFLGSSTPAPNTVLLHFSDGNILEKIAPYKNVLDKYNLEELKHFDIVEAEVIYHKKKLLIMVDFKIIYTGLDHKIGRPVDYDQFIRNGFKNLYGKVTIPKYIVTGVPEKITDSDIEDELDFSKLPYLMESMEEEVTENEVDEP